MNSSAATLKRLRLAVAVGAIVSAGSTLAQDVDHSTMDHSAMHHPPQQEPAVDEPQTPRQAAPLSMHPAQSMDHATHVHAEAAPQPVAADAAHSEAIDHSNMDHAVHGPGHGAVEAVEDSPAAATRMDHSDMPHSKMDHSEMDHSTMDHSKMDHSEMDHSGMDHSTIDQASVQPTATDHSDPAGSGLDHTFHAGGHRSLEDAHGHPREPIPVLTDADRRAAFPDLAPHPAHGDSVHSYFLANRLEAWDADHGTGMAREAQAWIGKDTRRLWIRSEGERSGGETEAADLELLYGRSISPWWEAVAGVRHDFKPGDAQSHLAIGVMGLAPQWFEIEATAYLSEHGRLSAGIEAEYEILLTNRLILQPLIEASFQAGSDPVRGIGSGLGTLEAGLRLRYEVTRRFAPYIGIVRERAFGDTADFRRESGEANDDTRVVAGLRIWF